MANEMPTYPFYYAVTAAGLGVTPKYLWRGPSGIPSREIIKVWLGDWPIESPAFFWHHMRSDDAGERFFGRREFNFANMDGCTKVMVVGEIMSDLPEESEPGDVWRLTREWDDDMKFLVFPSRTWVVVYGDFGDERINPFLISNNLRILGPKVNGIRTLWKLPAAYIPLWALRYVAIYPEFRPQAQRAIQPMNIDNELGSYGTKKFLQWMRNVEDAFRTEIAQLDNVAPVAVPANQQGMRSREEDDRQISLAKRRILWPQRKVPGETFYPIRISPSCRLARD